MEQDIASYVIERCKIGIERTSDLHMQAEFIRIIVDLASRDPGKMYGLLHEKTREALKESLKKEILEELLAASKEG